MKYFFMITEDRLTRDNCLAVPLNLSLDMWDSSHLLPPLVIIMLSKVGLASVIVAARTRLPDFSEASLSL